MNMLKWLLKLCLSAILVSFLTIITTGLVVNAYIQSLLASFNIQLEGQPFGLGTMMQSVLGSGGASDSSDSAGSGEERSVRGGNDGDSNTTSSAEHGGPSSDLGDRADEEQTGGRDHEPSITTEGPGNPSDEDPVPDDSIPVMGSADSSSEGSGLESGLEDEQLVMTPDDIVNKKGSLPLEDKEEIFTILMSRLPQSEMQKISEAMENGLTTSDLEEIERIISKYLNEDEYSQLLSKLQQ